MRISPFSLSPDPTALYVSPTIRSAIQQIDRMIDYRQGLAVICGDIGLGKSTLLRHQFGRYHAREDVVAHFVPTPAWISDYSMARDLCAKFNPTPGRGLTDQVNALRREIVKVFASGRNIVFFIDEAQLLLSSQIELVRSLLNFETDKEKMVQIVLAGQLDLQDRLRHRAYRAFKSRIYAPIALNAMTFPDMKGMLQKRCESAPEPIEIPFSPDALDRIYELSRGIPREILRLCDRAYAAAAPGSTITASGVVNDEEAEIAARA